MPTTLRKVSCWPAKLASGRSSAVADERTAKEACGSSRVSSAKAVRTASSSAGGNGVDSTHCRISAPAAASARTSSVSSEASRASMRAARPPWASISRKACAVVAKPPGTRTPLADSWLMSSPSEAFLPPTDSTSVILSSSKGTTRAVASGLRDMGQLRDDRKPGSSACRRRGQRRSRPRAARRMLWLCIAGGRRAWRGRDDELDRF